MIVDQSSFWEGLEEVLVEGCLDEEELEDGGWWGLEVDLGGLWY